MTSLVLIAPWFGPWPAWINLHLETCRFNPDVDWIIPTDQPPPENQPPNVRFLHQTLQAFGEKIAASTGARIVLTDPYKINDFKPALGAAFAPEIAAYDYFGYADLDIFFGQIRQIYTDGYLKPYVAVSSHNDFFAGHLSVFRNTAALRHAYRRVSHWRRDFEARGYATFDEVRYHTAFRPRGWLQRPFRRAPVLMREQYSTVDAPAPWHDGLPDHPQFWVWQQGTLTNSRDGARPFLYLHFMNWRSGRYRLAARGPAPWPRLERPLIGFDWREAAVRGFSISPAGIDLLAAPSSS